MSDVGERMCENKLQVNHDKTEGIATGLPNLSPVRCTTSAASSASVRVCDSTESFSSTLDGSWNLHW